LDLQVGLAAFGIVFVAEFGDKTQLALLALATRHKPWHVLAGSVAGFLVLTVFAVLVGQAAAAFLPQWALRLVGGLLFLVFAILAARRPDDDVDAVPSRHGGWVSAFLAVAVGEMGDKTQLATAALAGAGSAVAVGIGAFLALSASAVLAVAVGARLGKWHRPGIIRWASVVVFAASGLLLLASIWWPVLG
jgi:Ca2+/H+ antiporter, TMEM165/GDT1 family